MTCRLTETHASLGRAIRRRVLRGWAASLVAAGAFGAALAPGALIQPPPAHAIPEADAIKKL
ncbi:MAG: hypothetical protein ACKO0M_16785, partial [Cyanobium sp.]